MVSSEGVHGCLWQRAFGLCSGFDEVATDRFDAASVLRGKLCGGLFSCAIGCPKLVVLQALATIELLAAVMAFVALLTVAPPVLFDLF